MAKTNYVITSDEGFSAQLQTFKNTIGGYAVMLGLSPAQVTAQAADADYFQYVLACQAMMRNSGIQWTGWKDLMRDGGTPPPAGAPVAPTLPAAVPAVEPGIEVRFRNLVKQIKPHANYNEAIGEALGIEGPQQTGPDLTTVQPDIKATINGNRVEIGWGWNGNSAFLDLCEIEVDRNDNKGSTLLTYDSTPNYVDTAPFPTAPTKWTYRAIYRVGDQRVGQWSKPVSVTVGG